jgi:hypothetical protein
MPYLRRRAALPAPKAVWNLLLMHRRRRVPGSPSQRRPLRTSTPWRDFADARTLPGSFEPPAGLDPAQRLLSGSPRLVPASGDAADPGDSRADPGTLPASVASIESATAWNTDGDDSEGSCDPVVRKSRRPGRHRPPRPARPLGMSRPQPASVRTPLEVYGVMGAERDGLIHSTRQARQLGGGIPSAMCCDPVHRVRTSASP